MDTNDLEQEVNTRVQDALTKIEFLCEYRRDRLATISRAMMFRTYLLPLRRLSADERAEVVATAKAYARHRAGGSEEEVMRLLLHGFRITRKGRMDDKVRTVRTAVRCLGAVRYGTCNWQVCDSPYNIGVFFEDFEGVARLVMPDDEIQDAMNTSVAISRIARAVEQKHARVLFGRIRDQFDPERILAGMDKAERLYIERIRTW